MVTNESRGAADGVRDSDDGRAPFVRFDSLDPERGGRSFTFRGFRRAVVAHEPDDVVHALRTVERAVAGGLHAAGYIAYEAAPAFEPRLAVRHATAGPPLVWFGLFAERVPVEGLPAARGDFEIGAWRRSVGKPRYRGALARILESIAAGDTYQVNHTFRLRAPFHGSPASCYRHLCAAQRAAFCAYLRLPRHSILSASPELFFRWRNGTLELRPMKGTRRRGRWAAEDDALALELAASEKDRAENLMIVDLMRSDVGRLAPYGTVEVPELFRVERYPTVHQLTSTVRARTRADTRLEDVLRALFPSGSVTGAPKIRTSEIIARSEDSPRGIYTGAIGFVSPARGRAAAESESVAQELEAVFSVAIRTLVLDRGAGTVELGIGSGITADSDPEAEYDECLAKAAFVRSAAPEFRLLESMRHDPAHVGDGERGIAGFPLLELHGARMAASARYFGFPWDDTRFREHAEALAERLAGAPLAANGHKVRVLLDRAGHIETEAHPLPAASAAARVGIAPEPVDERDPLLYHKTTRREPYRSRRASRPDCDDVLLVNRRGELTEATMASIVVTLDGVRLTPPLDAGLLPGVFRAHLLERGTIRERRLVPADLARAEEIWLINAVRGWREARIAAVLRSGAGA